MTFDIRQADESNIPSLYEFYSAINKSDEGYFETVFEKDCIVLVAETRPAVIPRLDRGISLNNDKDPTVKPQDDDVIIVGFGILNFEPKYNFYQKLEIPEIQDVNVLAEYRQQGIATALIESFENLARDQGAENIGISVGLTKDYGPAQRLYCKLGYMPDGNGITYDRKCVDHGQDVQIDDDLCLMMIKSL